jgi:oligoribonuclease (3'-5' exoribonuclease)
MRDEITIIGLDFEASGTNPWGLHAPIQLGLTTGEADLRVEWNWQQFADDYEWSEEAFGVHGLTRDYLNSNGEPNHIVDARVAVWLYDNARGSRMNIVTTGWNVAGYDRQFVTRHMPYTNRQLSYRTADLGALCFALDGKAGKSWKDWKKAAKGYANQFIDPATRHDALTDAIASRYEYFFLKGEIVANASDSSSS